MSWPAIQSPATFFGVPAPSIREWCVKHSLGEEEYQGLVKLGFRVGDELDQLDDSSWRWANLGPLHKQRILAACLSDN